MTIFPSFLGTVNRFVARSWPNNLRMLVDPVTGAPTGIQNPNANGAHGIWAPVQLTAAQIASPTAEMLADLNARYQLNVAPYTIYQSNGSALLAALPFSFGAFQAGEMLVQIDASGQNVVAFQNNSATGYSAITFRGPDRFYPDGALKYEHGAIGYSYPQNFSFLEASRFDGTSNANLPPLKFTLMQSGGALTAAAWANCTTTINLPTITITAGGSFPSGINGLPIRQVFASAFDVIPAGTTIVSGAGTATLTLSANALSSSTFLQLIWGTPVFGQYHAFIADENSFIDWYTFDNGVLGTTPYIRMDRNQGYLGIGGYVFQDRPTSELDVIGNATFGTDRTQRFGTAYVSPINIWDTGTKGLNWVKVGVNTFRVEWNATPSRISYGDVNGGVFPMALFMDGSARLATPQLNISASAPPANAAATGRLGDVAWDTGFVYVCTATNTWKRVAIASW